MQYEQIEKILCVASETAIFSMVNATAVSEKLRRSLAGA